MFEKAARLKLRFPTKVGKITAEDLWDLPLTSARGASLDDTAKRLNRLVKESEEESFVATKSVSNTANELSFEVVKHVIKVRLEENEQAKTRADNKAKKERIMTIIAEKQDQALIGKSEDELNALLAEL